MSADNYVEINELEDGTFEVRYGFLSNAAPGRLIATSAFLEAAVAAATRFAESLPALEYGIQLHMQPTSGRT